MDRMREVRCCCDARLLGYLPARGELHSMVRFCLKPPVVAVYTEDSKTLILPEIEEFSLEVCIVFDPGDARKIEAYKSQDYPIEKLCKIQGWVEA